MKKKTGGHQMIVQELGKKLLLVFLLLFCLGTALPSDESTVLGELPFLVQTQAGKVCETRQSDQPAKEEVKSSPAGIKTTPPGQTVVRTAAGSLLLPRFYQSVYFLG